MNSFWRFLSDKRNQQVLSWLGGGLVVAATGLWVAFIYFFPAPRGRTIPTLGVNGIAHVREQKEGSQPAARVAPSAEFAITMRCRGDERTTDIPLPSDAIGVLALEAMSRDLDIAGLVGQILVSAINKDMIQKILHVEVPPSSA